MPTPTEPAKPRPYLLAMVWAASVIAIAVAGWFIMVFVVPRLERDAADQKLRLPFAAEWLIAVSRWHVKYWYVEAVPAAFLCVGVAALILMFPPQGRQRIGCWVLWLVLIG